MTPKTVAYQAPLSTGFSRQDNWSGLPFLPPQDLPDPGIEPVSLTSPALAGRFFTTEPPFNLIQKHHHRNTQDNVWASLIAQSEENLPAIWVQFLGQEDPVEKEMATHSSILV